jgi:hypothetical protein
MPAGDGPVAMSWPNEYYRRFFYNFRLKSI